MSLFTKDNVWIYKSVLQLSFDFFGIAGPAWNNTKRRATLSEHPSQVCNKFHWLLS